MISHQKKPLPVGLFVLLIFSVTCASSGPRLRSMTELAPPPDVTVVQRGQGATVAWQASRHESREVFFGYNVYLSSRSLIFAATRDLPQVATIPKGRYEYTVSTLPAGRLFLHVRSVDTNGNLSLPSLPEQVIEN